MIKIINKRTTGGYLFHYAHFLCDCLFPEIINDIYSYKKVLREKNIHQTIGDFHSIYIDVMMTENSEIDKQDFNNLIITTIDYNPKELYTNKIYFDKFRNFIFSRYNINYTDYDINYPEVLLIKRGERINLISDTFLNKINTNVTTGKERREIHMVDVVDKYLQNKYGNKFKSVYFEKIPFENQVRYFNNAKLIICAHGAVMSNMFFCKENTKIIEVTCNKHWNFFDKISNILNLHHIKCKKNMCKSVIECIKKTQSNMDISI